jgi:hypothetical protein
MTEFNPAAEAERLAKLALAEGEQIGDVLKTDAGDVETDVKSEVEKVAAEVEPAKTAAQTDVVAAKTDAGTVETVVKADTTTAVDAIKTAQAGVQAGVAAAKTDTATAIEQAHTATEAAIIHLEGVPSFLSAELIEAKAKLKAAMSWFEAHLTSSAKAAATPPTPPAS